MHPRDLHARARARAPRARGAAAREMDKARCTPRSRSRLRLPAARKGLPAEKARGIAPPNVGHGESIKADHLERTQLGESRLHGKVARPEQPLWAKGLERIIE